MKAQTAPSASTSAPSASTGKSLKRKDRDEDDEDEEEQQQDKEEKDDPSFEGESVAAPSSSKGSVKKKAKKEKKPLVKKVAVWQDIKEWKEGDDPLGRFPIEVLDLIISIDSDLDLRDHLALSATCRYFRTCYRDVVFQVLYHSRNPYHRLPAKFTTIGYNGKLSLYQAPSFIGPTSRSWNEARRIFSSSALPRDGWGVPNEEWEKDGKIQQEKERRELLRLLEAEREGRREAFKLEVQRLDAETLASWKAAKEVFDAAETTRIQALPEGSEETLRRAYSTYGYAYPSEEGAWGVERRIEAILLQQIEVYGSWVKPENHIPPPITNPRTGGYANRRPVAPPPPASTTRDAWASGWRSIISEVVNKPRITKTDAKKTYKVTDRELLSLPLVHEYAGKTWGAKKHYLKSAVEALSLRSHGGVSGHQDRLDKLQARKEKAHATMVKNGTLKVAKPKPPRRYGYGMFGGGYWDDYDEFEGEFDMDD